MSKKNEEYDFKWCPGCGDFGVRRALEMAMIDRLEETGLPIENNVVVAGIGCSGNLVHLLEGRQPYGFHGIHGRSLPISLGVKMARPELNVVVVAGESRSQDGGDRLDLRTYLMGKFPLADQVPFHV